MNNFGEKDKENIRELVKKTCFSKNKKCDECETKNVCLTSYFLNLVERDIKKPEIKEGNYYKCPSCDCVVSTIEDDKKFIIRIDYCPVCGQRLGRSDISDDRHAFKERYEALYGKSEAYDDNWEKEGE